MTNTKIARTIFIECLKFLGIGIPAAVFGWFLYGVAAHFFGLFITLVICGAVTVLVFLTLAEIFKIVEIRNIKSLLSKQ